jgi:hypothetical protein
MSDTRTPLRQPSQTAPLPGPRPAAGDICEEPEQRDSRSNRCVALRQKALLHKVG